MEEELGRLEQIVHVAEEVGNHLKYLVTRLTKKDTRVTRDNSSCLRHLTRHMKRGDSPEE